MHLVRATGWTGKHTNKTKHQPTSKIIPLQDILLLACSNLSPPFSSPNCEQVFSGRNVVCSYLENSFVSSGSSTRHLNKEGQKYSCTKCKPLWKRLTKPATIHRHLINLHIAILSQLLTHHLTAPVSYSDQQFWCFLRSGTAISSIVKKRVSMAAFCPHPYKA